MITQQLLEKFERYYGKGMARLVLFADWSGHTEVRDSAAWQYDFAFEDIAQLEAHLTKRAVDATPTSAADSEITACATNANRSAAQRKNERRYKKITYNHKTRSNTFW